MRFKPIFTHSHINVKWNCKHEGILHFMLDHRLYFLEFRIVDVKYKFVMDLEEHFAFPFFGDQLVMNVYHRNLDDIRSAALNWGIDGISLSAAANHGIG